jgi:hypothetical protein
MPQAPVGAKRGIKIYNKLDRDIYALTGTGKNLIRLFKGLENVNKVSTQSLRQIILPIIENVSRALHQI